MSGSIRINLPWTRPPLSLNDRLHWAAKARATRQVRETALWLIRSAKVPPTERLVVTLHYCPNVVRQRDSVNLVATLKPLVDGIVDAKIVPTDSTEHVSTPEPVIHPPEKGRPAAMWLQLDYPNGDAA